jgi:hypothetical protein
MSNPNAASNSSSNANWRKPSAAHLQKYNLRQLPDDFEPTEEEQQLLDMYEVIRNHERVAARLKEEAARAKLAAKDAEYNQKMAPKKNKRNRSQKPKKQNIDEDGKEDDEESYDEDMEDVDDDDDGDDNVEEALHDRREAKLAALREEVEEAKQAIAPVDQVDALRDQLLAVTEAVDDEPMLKRKRKDTEVAPSSLIANLTGAVTPPHDFSEKLELANRGKVLFPIAGTDEFRWTPPEGVFSPNERAFTAELNDFDITRAQTASGNNTIAIKVRFFVSLKGGTFRARFPFKSTHYTSFHLFRYRHFNLLCFT